MKADSKDEMVGRRFGKLLVKSRADSIKYRYPSGKLCVRPVYNVICTCGSLKRVEGNHLRAGAIKSCGKSGCKTNYSKRSEDVGINIHRNTYSGGARRRGLRFELSNDEFYRLARSVCYYCGTPPRERSFRGNGYTYRSIVNGIDRANNDIGYTRKNSVPCCTDCNYLKHTRNKRGFLSHIRRIATHQGWIKEDVKC
jgi:hypothetical protein